MLTLLLPSLASSHPMFLRQLSSFGSSFLPRSRPALCRAALRGSSASSSASPSRLHSTPTPPPPWWTVRGFPPWRPRLPHSHPAARQVYSGRTLHPPNINPGDAAGSWRSFNTSAGLMMERSDREPPPKRRKSAEEKRSAEEREGYRGGAAGGKVKDGGSKREQHHLDPSGSFPPNHRLKDASRDSGKHGAGKGVSRENSRDKDVERTKTWSKDRDGNRNVQRKDEASHRGRSTHQQDERKDSQPAAPRTQTSSSKPEQHAEFVHKPNPWQVAGGNTQPPPPGTCPPVKQQTPVKCQLIR